MTANIPRPDDLLSRLQKLSSEDLVMVDRLLMEIEARRLSDELGAELSSDWAAGRITEESIAQAVREHRSRHPYRG